MQNSDQPTISVYHNTVTPGSVPPKSGAASTTTYTKLEDQLWSDLRNALTDSEAEVAERNDMIADRDAFVYGDKLKTSLDIPVGHDFTPVNWLKRTVEIHKTQFMGRPFQVISTYDSKDLALAQDDQDKQRLQIENRRQKTIAELREQVVKDIIKDNGGHAIFMEGAENASVTGGWALKAWYDEDEKKYCLSPIETIENCYIVWSADDFRKHDIFAYVYQISKEQAMSRYNVPDDVAMSPLGSPLGQVGMTQPTRHQESQPMVSIIEATGKVAGWTSKNGRIQKCAPGEETEINVLYVGNKLHRVIDDKKKLPRYYVFPNKKERRKAWGTSDISEAAISLNLTYIETLSDWRTVASKVNFPKFKAFNFGPDTTLPKFKSRQIQALPLAEGQDMAQLQMGDGGAIDFRAQLEEIKSEFVRETGVSQILLDNAGMSMNSNQALITSMKPTSDIAENKKELWTPVLIQVFQDAMDTLAAYDGATYGDLAGDDDHWTLRIQWPSHVQKEDPIYQQMLMNRWNSGTMSLQSFLEAQSESAEEIERIRDEFSDMTTAAIHARELSTLFSMNFMPSPQAAPPKVSVNLRGELDPNQTANLTYEKGFNGGDNGGPFPTSAGPTGYAGQVASDNAANQGFLQGTYPNQTPVQKGPDGKAIATPANNTPGSQPVSQPGSGATPTSPQGALNQTTQNQGK